jgi:soluble lytic murein transglycosylase-like protein
MTIQLRLSGSSAEGLGVRQGAERRNGDRRHHARGGAADRRGRERRRNNLRSVAFSALALTLPSLYKSSPPLMPAGPQAQVTTWVERITPISPQEAYEGAIIEAAERYRLDPDLIRSVIQIESAFDALAVSPVGAQGLMQLMPAVAEEMGVQDPFNPRENIMGGARLLRRLLDHYRGNVTLTLAGYNAGPGAVKRFRGRVPPFKETQNYVKKITRLMADSRADGD